MNNFYLSMHSICVAQCGTSDWKLETYHFNFTKYSQSSQSSAFNLKLKNFGKKFHIKLHMHLCWTDRIHRNNFFCRNGESFCRLQGIYVLYVRSVKEKKTTYLLILEEDFILTLTNVSLKASLLCSEPGKINPHLNIWEIFMSAKW